MKIAVVGAGIFGLTAAIRLSKNHEVSLYEERSGIMTAASRVNQLRLHRGYHYPRSPDTVKDLLDSIDFFESEYQDAVVKCHEHFYCISKENSMTSAEEYLNFCNKFKLEHEIVDNFSHVNNEKIALTVKVKESILDYSSVYDICWKKLTTSSVDYHFMKRFTKKDINHFDVVLNCTYANINELLERTRRRTYQFEVCEKILVKMPEPMINKSIVVMDGPFMCVDPYGKSGLSLLGNVVHAIHSTNIGKKPRVSTKIKKDLNMGIVENPTVTNWNKFIETGKEYIPSLEFAKYQGSMFTVRAVLPHMDDTDGRPTIVSKVGPKIINIFSGKIDTCVKAAMSAKNIIAEME